MLTDDRSGSAGVIEVDVREEEVANLAEPNFSFGEACPQCRQAGGGAAIGESRAVVRLEEIAADVSRRAEVEEVDRGQRHGLNVSSCGGRRC